uniref:Reverse transcriptase domain-containing protein n=1 Tax=Tanacetum cinerariifolium TaxID=118510 RepID=A0A699HZD9_TANCI|nr:hypothetical protein [Tanacetum cinerariifolium]
MNHNINFSSSEQIQNPQYLNIQENPLTNNEFEAFMKANDDKINNLEIEFDHFQKQCEKMQDDLLNQMRNFMQNFQNRPPGEDKEHEATTNTELPSTEDIQPLPQKQKMKDTMLELVKICQEKEFLCIHDDVDNLIESVLDSKLLLINSNSQHLDKKEQEVKNVVEQPAERGNRKPGHSLSMRYEHLSITPETESDEITEFNAENLLPILSKCEVTLEDEIECDMPAKDVCSPVFTLYSNPLFKDNDNFDSSDDESLPDEDVSDGNSQQEEIDIVTETDDVLPPSIENFADDPEGDIHFLEELLIDESILSDELSDANFKENPLIPRPPPKPPDVETDAGEEIAVVMINKDKFDDDYQIFMFDKVFSLLSAKSEDTIFDPGLSPGD